MEREDPSSIIALWLSEFPKNQVPIGERASLMVGLIDEFKRFGYTKDDFRTGPIYRKVVSSCMNPNHKKPTEKRIWQEMVEKDLEIAVAKVFAEEIRAAQIAHTEESQKKLDQQKSTPVSNNDISNKDLNEPLTLVPPNTLNKPLDRSMFKDEPKFEVLRDKEFDKLLGLSDE